MREPALRPTRSGNLHSVQVSNRLLSPLAKALSLLGVVSALALTAPVQAVG